MSSFNRLAALQRGISFCSSNPDSASEEISPSSLTPRPSYRLLTIVRSESVSNCRETSNCERHNIKWIGWDVTASPWARQTFIPMALTVFMPPLACAGLSGDMGARDPRRSIDPHSPWRRSMLRPCHPATILCGLAFLLFLFQFAGKPFQLVTPVQFAHLLGIFPPIRRDLNKQPEVDFAAEDRLKF